MFKQQENNTVVREIDVIFPADGRGYKSAGTFKAELKILPEDLMNELADAPFAELVEEALVSVSDVGDAQGNPLPPEQAMEVVMRSPQAVSAIAKQIYEMHRGRPFAGDNGPRGGKSRRRR